MNIHVIFTGGTIGSAISDKGIISARDSMAYALIDMYLEKYNNDCCFTVSSPYYILSENLSAENIRLLIKEVNTVLNNKDLSGVIIAHGTDTLQYSAAILGYIFGSSDIPVVFVSSDYVLTDPRANGLCNFKYAVDFIRKKYGTGVFVSYRNKGGLPIIHRATRLNGYNPFTADITSIKYYGRFENNEYIQCGHNEMTEMQAMFDSTDNVKLDNISDNIIRITPYVGMVYPKITENTMAVLHESYHSGTICINDSFKCFAKSAMDNNVPIYLTGLCGDSAQYETVEKYKDYGIKALPDRAAIAQYCKLWLALSNGICIDDIMQTSVAYDHFVTF